MHELGIAEAIVDIAERHAGNGRVTKVCVKVGHMRQVVPSALSFSFELVAMGTAVDGAELELESVPAIGHCPYCDVKTEFDAFPLICHLCGGSDLALVSGDELIVESIEIDDEESDDVAQQASGPHGQVPRTREEYRQNREL